MKIVIFDTETTGLSKPNPTPLNLQPFMTEIFCFKIDGDFNKVSEFESMVKPPIPISKEITKITGITDQDVENAPIFFSIYDELYDFFSDVQAVVGHNIAFDIDIIHFELARHDLDKKFSYPKRHICTVESSYHFENKRLKLQDLHEKLFGVGSDGGHRARNDVIATAKCFVELCHRGDIIL